MAMSDEMEGHFFETFGPFDLPLQDGFVVSPLKSWWDEIDQATEGRSGAIGCYLFVMGRKNIKPWYVGKTVNVNGFCKEAFTPHKINHYNEIISSGYKGPPGLYLFPMITQSFHENWRFSSGRTYDKPIEWLERTLIGMAYSQNQDLANSRDTTFLRTVHVRGVMGSRLRGRRTGDIPMARQALLGEKSE